MARESMFALVWMGVIWLALVWWAGMALDKRISASSPHGIIPFWTSIAVLVGTVATVAAGWFVLVLLAQAVAW